MNAINRVLEAESTPFHQCWYPVALAAEVTRDKPLGVDFLGTRVVAYRDGNGRPVVQIAWCPHLGADLSQGQMIEGQLRCPYHHWRFAANGACAHIPTGDKIPSAARVFTYPTAEAWGLVWAFNGTEPLYEPPGIPGVDEAALAIVVRSRGEVPRPPWLGVSNGVDFQHLRTLHGLNTTTPPTVETGDHAIEFRVETERYMQHGRITGTNVFAQHLRRGDMAMDMFMLFAGAPVDRQATRAFFVVGTFRAGDGPGERQRMAAQLDGIRRFVETLIAEDDPVLNTMRFKVGTLTASDRHLSRYFKYVAEFPRFEPPE
jgi:phenylpropionate dioxygenase-like ring-hydroxylating dioxygenase large terminal subunit